MVVASGAIDKGPVRSEELEAGLMMMVDIESTTQPPPARRRVRQFGKSAAKAARKGLLECLGPGLITGASDDDPSGVATYSQAGAKFGFGMLWTTLFTLPLMAAIQEISARIGRVTGKGIAANLQRHYSPWLSYPIVLMLILANTLNLGADIGAMGAGVRLLIGGPAHLYIVLLAGVSLFLQIRIPYCRYAKFLKWLTLALFTYVGVVFTVHIPWGRTLYALVIPPVQFKAEYLALLVGVLGTTISPYLFFWQASMEVEDLDASPVESALNREPSQAREQLRRIRVDTYTGMTFSNLIAFFIMLTTAVTLHANGVTGIDSAEQAAMALQPIAGRLAFFLFAMGIIGTGMLALPVLAGSGAYALGELLKWPTGLERKWREAKGFYGILAVATILGTAMNFTHIDPMKALIWSAILNGIVAVPTMVVMMLMTHNSAVMGKLTLISKNLRRWGWLATAVMALAVIAMFATMGR